MKIRKLKIEKKIKIILCWLIFLFLILSHLKVNLVRAQIGEEALNALRNVAERAGYGEAKDPGEIILNIINYLLNFVGVFFLLMIVYGGLMWMTGGTTDFLWLSAPGKDQIDRIRKAKQLIRDAIIGLAIIILCKVIYYFVIERFGEAGNGGTRIR